MEYKFIIKNIFQKPELFMCFEEKYKMLENIFTRSALDFENKKDWLEAINDTLEGKLENGDFGVQTGFGADVGEEKTIIYCDFTDEEFEISTEEFKKLSEIWFDKLEQFNRTGKID
ncbi:hypothetical protein phiCT453A_28 (endogenous virus) [Clostridium phage phiCT453A]|uniref:hypothetical protein n=1 Tax=Clostridium phage phiCT453A TaxID=1567012 RepID=UPI00051346A7|nr:hypothetical protein [Clostridium tetani]YP_009216672.1 hypothetical protein phiCT453A_28 [Clostridium phage phiCT453A]AJA42518.1 hypothetical protein phiCT453A_28 [Clostridium phage phiCT453A]KGI42499.1 hypothetical protein KY55_10485 [Clostridium tetani]RXI46273.1 hypothetical protein DP126_04975 [Clostridium tetani]RXM58096.1 hypothetical protein DP133_07865 [Clostridium tetani]RXM61803.1 hypothetical protein DP138_03070 [Clostridium tetani]